MDPQLRHRILRGIGFEPMALEYTQPALQQGKKKCDELVLCVHRHYLSDAGAPSEPIAEWLAEFFRVLMGKRALRDPDFLRLKDTLAKQSFVPLLKGATAERTPAK